MRKLLVFSIVIALVFMTMPARAVNISNDLGMYYYSDKIPVTNGNYYFVCSAGSADGAGSDGYDGTNPRQPLATIDAAINKCTGASTSYSGDVIIVLPRHTEDLAAATTLVPDVAGLQIIGLGEGENRPRIDFTGTSGSILITGAGTIIANMIFECQIDNVVECIDVGADDVIIKNCEFRDYTGTSGQDFIMLDGANTADRFQCLNCTFYHLNGTENGDSGIYIDDAQDHIVIKGCRFTGDYDNAPIYSDADITYCTIADNLCQNLVSSAYAIDLGNSATGFIVNNMLYTDAAATALDPGTCYCFGNKFSEGTDGQAIDIPASDLTKLMSATDGGSHAYPDSVTNESVFAYIMSKSATAAITSYNNTTDSLEAIADAVGTLSASTGLPYYLVTADSGDTSSIIDATYAGKGNDYFNTGWVATCIFNDGAGTAPEGETRDITDYVSATGDFTVSPVFTGAVGAADVFFVYYDPLRAVCSDVTDAVSMSPEIPDDSILANILTIDGDVQDYDRRYDSLEALGDDTDAIIADFTDYALDHVAGVTDGGTHLYPDSVANDTVFAYIMSDDDPAAITSYNNSTDSLEAISNALAAGTGCTTAIDADGLDHLVSTADGTGVYPASVVEDSILAKILGDDATAVATTYNNTTDSLEAIGSKTEFITHVATCTTTAAAQTDNMFDVGGPILITSLFGVCTTAASDDPGDMTIEFDATTGADYDNDLSTTVTVNALGAGDAIHFSNAIDEGVLTLTANVGAGQPLSWICGDPSGGVIEQTLTSTGTMNITWYMTYIPLTATSTVAAST